MVDIQDVSFEYEKEQGTLSHIDLRIRQGECVLLCGESGCGKTTVTKLVNGLIPYFVEGGALSGRTVVNGMEVADTEMYRLAEQVGSVFQNPKSQFFNIDSDSEITFGLENAGVRPEKIKERFEAAVSALKIEPLLGRNIFSMSGGEKQSLAFASVYVMNPSVFVLDEPTANLDAEAIDIILKAFDLLEFKDRHPMALSGGQKQRLAIAAAILSGKRLFVFDEPTSGLDYRHMLEVSRVLRDLEDQGCIVLVVFHDGEFMEKACDRISNGTVTAYQAVCRFCVFILFYLVCGHARHGGGLHGRETD